MDEFNFSDNAGAHRFELTQGNQLAAVAEYKLDGGVITFTHTEVKPQFQATKGLGSKIAAQALQDVRGRGLKVVPMCEFIARYIVKHAEYGDLLTDEGRLRVEAAAKTSPSPAP